MKSLQYILSAAVIVFLAGMMSCHKKPGPNPLTDQQKQAQALSGTWTTVKVDQYPSGVDTTVVSSLTLTFNTDTNNNPTTFSASGAPDFFTTQSSSTWAFSGTSTSVITLSNVTPVTGLQINSLVGNSLTVKFTYVTPRLDGDYQLTMSK